MLNQKQINPEMLVLARQSRGLTQAELADRLGVSQGMISKVQDGLKDFPIELIGRLETELGYPREFYARDWAIESEPADLFRRLKSTSVASLKQCTSRMIILKNQVRELISGLDSRPPILRRIDVDDVQGGPIEIAREMRRDLRVPDGPIQRVMQIVERSGCIIIPFDFMTSKIDACCDYVDGWPLIFVNMQTSPSRLRFSILHEMGHLIMHKYPTETSEEEANRFASEFLIPSEEIRQSILPLNLQKLGQLKLHWKASMQCILVSAYKMGVISKYNYENIYSEINFRGYKYKEPLEEFIPKEEPQALKKLIGVYTEKLNYSLKDISTKLSISESEFIAQFSSGNLRMVV
jgi:Zn-dependent peptidase ImmA (M78 family)/transcriptional regulator with XRE-family HTH domain